MRPIRIAEGNVNSRQFLVLENVPDNVFQSDIGSDGELAHPVAICVRVRVIPERLLQFFILRVRLRQPVPCDANCERRVLKISEFRA